MYVIPVEDKRKKSSNNWQVVTDYKLPGFYFDIFVLKHCLFFIVEGKRYITRLTFVLLYWIFNVKFSSSQPSQLEKLFILKEICELHCWLWEHNSHPVSCLILISCKPQLQLWAGNSYFREVFKPDHLWELDVTVFIYISIMFLSKSAPECSKDWVKLLKTLLEIKQVLSIFILAICRMYILITTHITCLMANLKFGQRIFGFTFQPES